MGTCDFMAIRQLYDAASGRLLLQSPGLAPLGLRLTTAEVGMFVKDPATIDIATEYGRVRISNTLVNATDGHAYLLQVGLSLAAMDAALRRYRDPLLWRGPVALIAAVAAAWWLSGLALRPLTRLSAAVHTIDVDTLQRRLPVRGAGDELDDVARAFNATLSRLEHAVGEMRQFSAALAHELRTPLSALRGEIELALRKPGTDDSQRTTLVSQIEEIDRLKRLIDQILTLARAEVGQIPVNVAAVDLSALATMVVEQLEPVADARGIELRGESRGPVVVAGDAAWLERLLLNLIDNALKFTSPGGRVRVIVGREGPGAMLQVVDTGAGMTPEVVSHAFERFYRGDPARSSTAGAGLGLSLVQWIVDRHDGTIAIESALGQGTTVHVSFPATTRRLA
jgi:two-component system, OmpR family, heavy metal sensor histidine kinase CusS